MEFRDYMSHHALFTVGTLLIVGYIIGKLVSLIKLPEITGFIIAGLLLGESAGGIVNHHNEEELKLVTDVALGLIALTIGGEFYWAKLKRMGKEVVILTVLQIVFAFAGVALGLFLFNMELPFALMLGAISTATAPAATVHIVQSLRAHGIFVDYLYGVVALDDAGAVVVFGIVFAMASSMLNPAAASEGGGAILHAFSEVGFSIVLGVIAGFVINVLTIKMKNKNEIMITTLGLVFLTTAGAIVFHLSPLLTNMAVGAVLINLSAKNHRLFRILEPFTPPIYALFFVIAGTELNPGIILQQEILIYGLIYVLIRAGGKYLGIYLGGKICKLPDRVTNNLGLCMFPQAGVAIGLVLLVQASPWVAELSEEYLVVIDNMVNIVLFSVFVNELVGPPISRYAVIKGNEMEE